MNRRSLLASVGGLATTTLAGCGALESRSLAVPTVVAERPAAIYVPSHVEGMARVATAQAGPYGITLTYSYPHRFWTVTGETTDRVSIDDEDSIHLMATVWDRETGAVVPEAGVTVEITRNGDLVSQETIYPMLSGSMGVHHGANVAGLVDGRTYSITVSVGPPTVRTTGAYRGRFDDPASATLAFTFDRAAMEALRIERLDRAGERGALEPTGTSGVPTAQAPPTRALPGRTATARAGAVSYAVAVLESPPGGIDSGPYLAVSPRTRYNAFPLTRMGLTTVLEGMATPSLSRTFDPSLGYHYGTALETDRAGALSVRVETPPQLARHEGYETAFFEVPRATVRL